MHVLNAFRKHGRIEAGRFAVGGAVVKVLNAFRHHGRIEADGRPDRGMVSLIGAQRLSASRPHRRARSNLRTILATFDARITDQTRLSRVVSTGPLLSSHSVGKSPICATSRISVVKELAVQRRDPRLCVIRA